MQPVQKQVFLIMFTGGNFNMLRSKIVRLCDSFGAPLYDLPDNVTGYNSKLAEVENQLRETKNVKFFSLNLIHLYDLFLNIQNKTLFSKLCI